MKIGIDLGGTKISIIALDEQNNVLVKKRIPTPRNDYIETLETIETLVTWVENETGQQGSVGMGMPGSIAPGTGRVQNANSVWLNNRRLQMHLEEKLDRPVRLANDANCFILSEARDGAAKGAKSAFGVIIGTGCGGGMLVDGKLITGKRNSGGEWGHVPLPWAEEAEKRDTRCWCGRKSCLETWISGTALAKHFNDEHRTSYTSKEIVARAEMGDEACCKALAIYAGRLARGLAMIVNIFDPEVIVLGGGLSNLDYLYQKVPAIITPYIFAHDTNIKLLPPVHGDDSGVRGAAFLWDD